MHSALNTIHAPHAYQDRAFGELQPLLHDIASRLAVESQAAACATRFDDSKHLDKLANKLANCVVHPLVYGVDDPEQPVLVEARCKSRLCPRCSRFRSRKLIQDLRYYVTLIDSPRFLTLTLASVETPLREQLLRLRKCFAKLRRSKTWKAHVVGGLYTVEVTFNRNTRRWHPHIHAITDGKYFAHSHVAEAWHKATGDSHIVDIRACHGRGDAINYLASYISKSSDAENFPPAAIAEWALNVAGLRFFARFGTLHKAKLPSEELRESIAGVNLICSAEQLALAAVEGDTEADQILRILRSRSQRRVSDGEPGSPRDASPTDRPLALRLRAWSRGREELLRDQHQRAERPWEFVDSYHRTVRIGQVRAPPDRGSLLPFRDTGYKL